VLILCTRDRRWMRLCDAVLLADGVDSRWARNLEGGGAMLDVATSECEHVVDLLSEQLSEELRLPRPSPADLRPLLLQPAFALALCSAALLVAFFWVTGPLDLRGPWFREGALFANAAQTGQWWRLVTAATLHSDAGHALGNAAFLVFLGWAVAERLGGGVMLAVMLLAAVGGFGASLAFSDAGVTVGASGGMFGLLGASAGHGLRQGRDATFRHLHARHHVFRVLGAALMLLAFTAFSRESNIEAHVGGFATGLAMGLALPPRHLPWPVQIAAGVGSGLLVFGAWWLA
jgi:membrane associated rhomboid family serine protease